MHIVRKTGFPIHVQRHKKSLHIKLYLILVLISSSILGCRKLVEVDGPIDSVIGQKIYSTNTGAAAVLTGIYSTMSSEGSFTGTNSISLAAALSADELIPVTMNDIKNHLYSNSLTNNGNQLFWSDLYSYIFKSNSAIEGINASDGITEPVKQQLLGEAKFIRAFMYFYLVNLYGDVPLLLSTDIKINSIAPRSEKTVVYKHIIADLEASQSLLNENYLAADVTTSTTERLRPNKGVATALLARVYLYTKQWKLAEQESSKLISNLSTYQLETLNDVYLITSREAIWQLQPVSGMYNNTLDARIFILAAGDNLSEGVNITNGRPVYINNQLFNAFEDGDNRKSNWINTVKIGSTTYPYAYKYKAWLLSAPKTEYLMVLRLGEQYLIRAEARAEQGMLTGANSAQEDLNAIRNRAGLKDTTNTNKEDLLNVIRQEKKVELFTEWGHRWFDLKRSDKIDQLMMEVTPMKGGTWAPYKSLYPIPTYDIKNNPSLRGNQNPGYPEQ